MDVIDTDNQSITVMSDAISNGKICHFNPTHVTSQIQQLQQTGGGEQKEPETVKTKSETMMEKQYGWMVDNESDKAGKECYDAESFARSECDQFVILVKRMFLQNTRNSESLLILFFHHLLCAFLVGSVFYNTANDAYQMFNHLKFCVGYVLFHTYTNVMLPVLVFPTEVKLVKKEHFNKWYSLNSYYSAVIVTKLPIQILFGTMFSAIIYFMSGLPAQPLRFVLFALIGILIIFVSDAAGMAIGSVFSVTNGSAVGPAIVAPFLGLAVYGFDFAREVPWITYAIMKLSFMRCGVIATALTLFGLERETLDCTEVYCHFKEPRVVLHFLDVEHVSIWSELSVLCLLIVFFRILSYLALRSRLVAK